MQIQVFLSTLNISFYVDFRLYTYSCLSSCVTHTI